MVSRVLVASFCFRILTDTIFFQEHANLGEMFENSVCLKGLTGLGSDDLNVFFSFLKPAHIPNPICCHLRNWCYFKRLSHHIVLVRCDHRINPTNNIFQLVFSLVLCPNLKVYNLHNSLLDVTKLTKIPW